MFAVVPACAADQSDSLPEFLSAIQQFNREMANPEMQRSVAEAVAAGANSQAEEAIKQRTIIERCAGTYIATVSERDYRLTWPNPGDKVTISIDGRACVFGSLEFEIVSAGVDGLGLEATRLVGITGNIDLNQDGKPAAFALNNGKDLTSHFVTATIAPIN